MFCEGDRIRTCIVHAFTLHHSHSLVNSVYPFRHSFNLPSFRGVNPFHYSTFVVIIVKMGVNQPSPVSKLDAIMSFLTGSALAPIAPTPNNAPLVMLAILSACSYSAGLFQFYHLSSFFASPIA